MNGKSANLNNAMNQIYPEDLIIPPNELVCIFDADQVLPVHLGPSCKSPLMSASGILQPLAA